MFYSAIALLLIGVASIAAAFKYTVGKNPYGYRGLGDIAVIVFFGFVGVIGSNFLQTHTWDVTLILPSLTIGCLSAAVLNLNNLRDHINDAASNKNTLIVKIGFERGKIYHYTLLLTAFFALSVFLLLQPIVELRSLLILLVFILFIPHIRKVRSTAVPAELDSQLKVVALLTFLLSLVILFLV
jgi:1,4-dihydroxy-2-naphthoate octaprenyltransferase